MKRLSVFTAAWVAAVILAGAPRAVLTQSGITEAPTGFDNLTNGFVDQLSFDEAKAVFAEQETIEDGLGPVYNAQSCGECHQNPITGSGSQIVEQRAGSSKAGVFTDHAGGSLIHSRSTYAELQERILPGNNVNTFRTSLSTLGDGFVEALADDTLRAIAAEQPIVSNGMIHGLAIDVPVGETEGLTRVGRFGWKAQHASLISFSADAYLNEMGITSPLQPTENTANGFVVSYPSTYDPVPDPEDEGEGVVLFATFMRATKAPPRDGVIAATPQAQLGALLFNQVGCDVCHRPSIVTAPPGTVLTSEFTVPAALGNKQIHPFGDFLLHDIGTGDGIVQNGGQATRNMVRTAPLWGLRTRNRLMHDGLSFSLLDAINRHDGEAKKASHNFKKLNKADTEALLVFLSSL